MAGRAPHAAVPPPFGRKAKAPPPPSETKTVADCPIDDTESANIIMEQKENVIDKDIELSVVLPGDVIKYTTVNGRKPMMDLLIFLCAQYHLNPSSYTIELVSAENSQIKFKPNTPVGMLEVEKVIVKPKQMDKKKPAPVIPEQTVRVVINYKKTQKTVVRVSPHSPLQELIPIICSKCEFDPSHTVLLKNYQSQEALDVTKSLNDLGLRELYAMDISRATSPVDLPSLKDSYRASENSDVLKEKENKGFFSFFQRSKKKREQTASAPATPLMSKPRPTFTMRSSTVSKQYDSNTLPSEMPKKRRAPLPPMPNSQSAPQELAEVRTDPDIVKSNSLDRNQQAPSGLVRKGSLPLSDTASVSSLRRMKRKAPSPPSRTPEDQSENSNETVTESREPIPTEMEGRAAEMQSETGARTSEYSLEEIDEKEEMSVQEGEGSQSIDTSLRTREVTATTFSSTEVPLETERNDRASSVPVPGTVSLDNSQSFKEEKQENMSTDGKELQAPQISSDQAAFEKDGKLRILEQNKKYDHCDRALIPTNEREEEQTVKIEAVDFRENSKLEVDRLSNCQTSKNDITISHRNYTQLIPGKQDQKTSQTSLDTVKTQDVAIQTGPLVSNLGRTAQKEMIIPQEYESSTFERMVHQRNTDTNNPRLQVMQGIHKDEEISTEQNLQKQEVSYEKMIPVKDEIRICTNGSNAISSETIARTPDGSPVKGYPVYRQGTKPKPKPANEITRDYIPKIGMTTYKIVPPPKSLETIKIWESEVSSDYTEQEVSASKNSLRYEDSKEFIMQTEIPHLPKSAGHVQGGLQNIPAARNDLLHRVNSISEHGLPSVARITTEINQTETVSSKQHVPLMLSLSNSNASSETQEKSNALSPTTKPSSFYLQMQRRVSGHYVSSAIARSTICAPNSTQDEVKNNEMEKKISSPDETSLHMTSSFSPSVDEVKSDDGKKMESPTSPVKNNKPPSFPSSQPAPLNLKTLRTFAVPKPYSSSRPSPFALAVSSAVKRSQSFNKTRTIASLAPREEFPVEISSASSATELSSATSVPQVKNNSLHSITGGPQNSLMDKKSSTVNSEQNVQAQSGASADHPPPIIRRQTSLPVQRSDPEQIHQSLLAAIRSGEAAARLKRVGPPSNTVSVNGRARLNHLYSTEAKADH
ncbi:cordon-bleu protein-like 1 [Cyrtonyx montezumae]|uniref:cordon-bleu protein-like 1 n=1 Tax=Cyrtonyx montezumae TaxID=9017 RepID=UPI0032DB7908